MNPVTKIRLAVFVIIAGLLLSLWGANYPFVGIYNTNNNYLSLAAKNYQRFGFLHLKLFPTYFAGKQFTEASGYYLHHPVLIFLLSALPILLFRFQNWSVHATNFLFVIGDIFMIYVIAKEVWNMRVGLWAAALAALFPMTTFFWKYIFFEQGSLFFNLIIYYLFIRYLKRSSVSILIWIFLVSMLSGLIDWGVLYLLFPLGVFFVSKYRKAAIKPYIAYLVGAGVSLSAFVASVFLLQHGFKELGVAIWGRSYTSELTGLSFWPLRLILITILRMLLYFTPVAVAGVWTVYKLLKGKIGLPELTVIAFFIFGCLNLLFLPAASWGHSYFLYYFIPFFAFAGGLFFESLEKKPVWLWTWICIIVLTSVAVNFLKIQQVEKQLWKYDVAVQINKTLVPYETVGVVNFAGDVFENYFLHPSQPIAFSDIDRWLTGEVYPAVTKSVYVCAGVCTSDENAKAKALTSAGLVTTYEAGGNEAWLVTKKTDTMVPVTELVRPSIAPQIDEGNIFLKIYRQIRDTLSVGQI